MKLGAQVAYRERWSTAWEPSRVLNAVDGALKRLNARIVSETPLRLEAKCGRLRHVLVRSPARWPMHIDIEVMPTEAGSDAVLVIRSDVPVGTRLGSESSYMSGLSSVAKELRGDVSVLKLGSD